MLVSSLSLSGVDQLRGKRIGISQKGATNHLALVSFLRKHGIDPETGVHWVEGGTPIERVNRVIAGGIDATWTTSQTLALFEGKREAFKILASGKELAEGGGIAYLVGVARAELVEAEPQTVLSVVKALIKASREFSKHQEVWVEAAAKRRPEVGREAIKGLWEQTRGHWPVNGRLDPKWVKDTSRAPRQGGRGPGDALRPRQEVGRDALRRQRPERARGIGLVEGRLLLRVLPARLRRLVLPVQDLAHLVLGPRGHQLGGLVPGPDAPRVDEEPLVPGLYRHPDGVALRPRRPHQGDAPGARPRAEEEVDLGAPVVKVRDLLAEGDHRPSHLLHALLHLVPPRAKVVALGDDREVDVVDHRRLPPKAPRELRPLVEV